jgi:hypothetical protein
MASIHGIAGQQARKPLVFLPDQSFTILCPTAAAQAGGEDPRKRWPDRQRWCPIVAEQA